MTVILDLLKNKKMYGLAIILVGLVVAEKIIGIDVPGIEIGDDWLGYIIAGLGLGATKAAIAKTA